jgi:DNA-binding response OmpR family regulator
MKRIMLAGEDRQARALLRAQLIEEGFEVKAHTTVPEALASIEAGEHLPDLLIVDLSKNSHPRIDVELLKDWAGEILIWIIASHGGIDEPNLKDQGFERFFFKPLDVGSLIERIKEQFGR